MRTPLRHGKPTGMEDGRPLDPAYVTRLFQKIRIAAGAAVASEDTRCDGRAAPGP